MSDSIINDIEKVILKRFKFIKLRENTHEDIIFGEDNYKTIQYFDTEKEAELRLLKYLKNQMLNNNSDYSIISIYSVLDKKNSKKEIEKVLYL